MILLGLHECLGQADWCGRGGICSPTVRNQFLLLSIAAAATCPTLANTLGFQTSIECTLLPLSPSQMPIVSSTFWNMILNLIWDLIYETKFDSYNRNMSYLFLCPPLDHPLFSPSLRLLPALPIISCTFPDLVWDLQLNHNTKQTQNCNGPASWKLQ